MKEDCNARVFGILRDFQRIIPLYRQTVVRRSLRQIDPEPPADPHEALGSKCVRTAIIPYTTATAKASFPNCRPSYVHSKSYPSKALQARRIPTRHPSHCQALGRPGPRDESSVAV